MSDRFAARITIGGTISAGAVFDVLNGDGVGSDWGDIQEIATVDQLSEFLNENGHLVFTNAEILNGEFEQTENFCQDNDIPFDRWSDNYCECDAEHAHYRPGMTNVLVYAVDVRCKPILFYDVIEKALEQIEFFRANYNITQTDVSRSRHWKILDDGINLLKSQFPKVEPLSKFDIVD